jgi:hypothetical protein
VFVIVWGNPFDGLSLEGPYDSHEDAMRQTDGVDSEWHIVVLDPPSAGFQS